MKKLKNIFVVFVLAVLTMPVVAAENGCDNDDNDMIAAELALCSTHAYNIGMDKNPSGADKSLMRDVIAMKTTVITQQMYKQYEQMESMLRRFTTQLEKAVLTTSLEAKGATLSGGSSSSSISAGGGGYRQDNRNIFMDGVRDCNTELTTIKVFECLSSNLTTIYNMSSNGANNSQELRKQLAKDYGVMDGNKPTGVTFEPVKLDDGTVIDCTKGNDLGNKKKFQKCLDALRSGIRRCYEAAQNEERKYQNNNYRN